MQQKSPKNINIDKIMTISIGYKRVMLCLVLNVKGKEIERKSKKTKNKFKINKKNLYVYLNLFYLFFSLINLNF